MPCALLVLATICRQVRLDCNAEKHFHSIYLLDQRQNKITIVKREFLINFFFHLIFPTHTKSIGRLNQNYPKRRIKFEFNIWNRKRLIFCTLLRSDNYSDYFCLLPVLQRSCCIFDYIVYFSCVSFRVRLCHFLSNNSPVKIDDSTFYLFPYLQMVLVLLLRLPGCL